MMVLSGHKRATTLDVGLGGTEPGLGPSSSVVIRSLSWAAMGAAVRPVGPCLGSIIEVTGR